MRVYCYSKCSTCKKALAWLDENDVSYELLDIKTNHPGLAELAAAYEKERTASEAVLQHQRKSLQRNVAER